MRAVRYWVSSIILASASVAVAPQAMAQQEGTTPDSVPQSLQAKVDELDQQVRILQRLRELAADSAAAAAKDKVSATASGKDGFSIKSADGKYAVRLKGLVQADGRFFLSDSAFPVTNTFFLRRARPILEATVGKYLEFRLQPDFGQGHDRPVRRLQRRKGLAGVRGAGRQVQSRRWISSACSRRATSCSPSGRWPPTSRPTATSAFSFRAISGPAPSFTPPGVFNGVPDLGNGDGDVSDAKDFAARVFLQPFKTGSLAGLGFGVAGSTGIERGTTAAPQLASYRTPGQQTWFRYLSSTTTPATNVFADGTRQRLAPQAYWYNGRLGLQGEYILSWQEVTRAGVENLKLQHTAWQTTGSFFLTGEKNSWKSVTPKKGFDPAAGTFGALELAARYSELSIDDATFPAFANPASTPSKAKAWAVGLNWYLAKAIKVVLDYEHTTFDGGTATGDDREPENLRRHPRPALLLIP